MKKVFAFVMLAIALLSLTLSGCATYSAKGVMPNLNDPSTLAAKDKLITKAEDGVTITVYPVTNEDEVKKFFDEDLLDKKILPVFIQIQNESENTEIVGAILYDKDNSFSAMTPGDLYAVIKRDWVARATYWMFQTYFIGAPISAAATHYTNTKIQEDLGVNGESGKLLRFGKISKEGTKGFLCFKQLDKKSPEENNQKESKEKYQEKSQGKMKLIFQRNSQLFQCIFDLSI